jgi:hypothetical protein
LSIWTALPKKKERKRVQSVACRFWKLGKNEPEAQQNKMVLLVGGRRMARDNQFVPSGTVSHGADTWQFG